jgi:membrane fusion protein, multidrug efflux system
MTRLLLSSALIMWSLAGCGGGHEAREIKQLPSVAVQAVDVEEVEWPSVYEAVGTVSASKTTTLSAKVMGYVKQIEVDAGDRVKAGQVLVVLDSRDLEVGYRQAMAARAEAKSAMAEVESAIIGAKAQLELAESTFKRMESLHEKKSITEQEFDEASAKVRMAKANYEMAASKTGQLTEKIAQAEQGVESAAIMKGYAELTAPFNGRVTKKMVDPGSLAAPGAPLLTIEGSGAYRFDAQVEESRLRNIRVGDEVELTIDALADAGSTARVSEIIPSVDGGSRTFTVRINMRNTAGLRSGLFGRAKFATDPKTALVIPGSAVVTRGQVKSVYVISNGQASVRLVTLGNSRDGQFEVFSGLAVGERIVSPAPVNLVDGSPVEVRP